MAIGTGIFLIAVGAILAFALNESVDAVNLYLVGWILMGAGLLAVIISLIVNAQNRKRTTVTEQRSTTAPQQQGGQVSERREDTGPAV
ncbi:DUF6458 family protein [Demequina sp. NBRC 110053]|uniref:DUF6458 family protein n=1 Tax=Demequina sp. NBRC 110053 TaxID=1570342 RepID=UPI0009FEACEF|nr:DUF6458 family protein [Demequina sp. NBRC 110053]